MAVMAAGRLKPDRPPVPRGLRPSGRELWVWVNDRWRFDPHELVLLLQACGAADECDWLEGVLVQRQGLPDCMAALKVSAELRAVRATYVRMLRALKLPAGLSGAGSSRLREPARRGGFYAVPTGG